MLNLLCVLSISLWFRLNFYYNILPQFTKQLPKFDASRSFRFTQPPSPEWDIGQGIRDDSPLANEWNDAETQGWKSWTPEGMAKP